MTLLVDRIPAFVDNYIWMLHDTRSGATAVVDPGEAAPVLDALARCGRRLDWILNTHHHRDHTGANLALKAATGCRIAGADLDRHRIPGIDLALADGDTFRLGESRADVLLTTGHTTGHLCYWFARDRALFSGDTLFLMGCGRLMEGDAAMMLASLSRLAALPRDTNVYCAHEYTLPNARFARSIDPDNAALRERCREVETRRARNDATVPATLGEELDTNPFLRTSVAAIGERLGMAGASPIRIFAELRRRKDAFV